jgi:hypothetical protein
MKIDDLLPLQESVRDVRKLLMVMRGISVGGINILKHADTPIVINRFEVDTFKMRHPINLLHDGHHRVIAAYLLDYLKLPEGSYIVKNLSINDYEDLNLSVKWTTPMNPKNYSRRCNLETWHDFVEKFVIPNVPPENVKDFIIKNRFLYCMNRNVFNMAQLINKYIHLKELI